MMKSLFPKALTFTPVILLIYKIYIHFAIKKMKIYIIMFVL